MKPDFIGVSAGRSGTAWVYNCLSEHPQLCLPFKTITFFSNDDEFAKGFEWYENHFRTCSPGKVVGEISMYLHSEKAPKRIYDYHPDVKIFIPLRNPVDRAFASYENDLDGGIVAPSVSFEEAVKHRPIYIERSYYFEALQRYRHYFSRDQLLVLIYEDGLEDPEAYFEQIFRFLGVEPDFHPSMLREWVNVGGPLRSVTLGSGLDNLALRMRRLRMQKVIWLLKKSGIVGFVRRANLKGKATPMTAEQRAQLQELFTPDIKALETLLGRDLSMWLDREQRPDQGSHQEAPLPPAKGG